MGNAIESILLALGVFVLAGVLGWLKARSDRGRKR